MKRSVVLIPKLGSPDRGDLSTIVPQNISVPEGFLLTGGERKFIVVKGKEGIALIIGPVLLNFYNHKHILESINRCKELGQFKISGGGRLTFSFMMKRETPESPLELRAKAHFGEDSAQFGVFDPEVLNAKFRALLEKEIGIPVSFEWKG